MQRFRGTQPRRTSCSVGGPRAGRAIFSTMPTLPQLACGEVCDRHGNNISPLVHALLTPHICDVRTNSRQRSYYSRALVRCVSYCTDCTVHGMSFEQPSKQAGRRICRPEQTTITAQPVYRSVAKQKSLWEAIIETQHRLIV